MQGRGEFVIIIYIYRLKTGGSNIRYMNGRILIRRTRTEDNWMRGKRMCVYVYADQGKATLTT
jgi:hypothetical protein